VERAAPQEPLAKQYVALRRLVVKELADGESRRMGFVKKVRGGLLSSQIRDGLAKRDT
jgi:hypothetical protein